MPDRNDVFGTINELTLRVAVTCLEKDKARLPFMIHRELVWVAHLLLNDDSQIGIDGCKIVEPMEDAGKGEAGEPEAE